MNSRIVQVAALTIASLTLWSCDSGTPSSGGSPDQFAIVTGTVSEAISALPLEGVTVSIDGKSDVTDETGQFRIQDVEFGSRQIAYTADGFESTTQSATINMATVNASAQLTLENKTVSFSGILKNAFDSVIVGATVAIGASSTQSAGDGSFTLSGVQQGIHDLIIRHDLYIDLSKDVLVYQSATVRTYSPVAKLLNPPSDFRIEFTSPPAVSWTPLDHPLVNIYSIYRAFTYPEFQRFGGTNSNTFPVPFGQSGETWYGIATQNVNLTDGEMVEASLPYYVPFVETEDFEQSLSSKWSGVNRFLDHAVSGQNSAQGLVTYDFTESLLGGGFTATFELRLGDNGQLGVSAGIGNISSLFKIDELTVGDAAPVTIHELSAENWNEITISYNPAASCRGELSNDIIVALNGLEFEEMQEVTAAPTNQLVLNLHANSRIDDFQITYDEYSQHAWDVCGY